MNKSLKILLSFCLCICFMSVNIFPVYAQTAEQTNSENELHITNADEFIAFAENCRLDSYSKNLNVFLDADINLANTKFENIPIFCGTFNGNGYTISGLSLSIDGSHQGLFRYLSNTAYVKDLNVSGNIVPNGSRTNVGGIVGRNAGKIENCTFSGLVSGTDKIGGIAGTNNVSGIIENCKTSGGVQGLHFVGGIVGENDGLVRNSVNLADINITAEQNEVNVSDINVNTIVGTEKANTVTDIGGIAGTNKGVIRSCYNHATVGYKHIGYNIGGISGSQMGYIVECKNYGKIYGRKEIGGIVGQMEPITKINYTRDTLQILQQQLANTSALTNQASQNAQNNANAINSQISSIHNDASVAKDAIVQLSPNFDGNLPDEDSIIAAENALNSSITSMQGNFNSLTSSTQAAVDSAANDIKAITNQIHAINNTISNASNNLGIKVTDISDKDTADNFTGKVEACVNYGSVLADLNAGGIAGAIALENDMDHEDDIQFNGNQSLNLESEMRSVILNCENKATVSAKKRQVGGIVGLTTLGLVKDCVNTGYLDAESANYVGGIVGNSDGYIRNNSSKCQISGASYVGGIAGKAAFVSDCQSMVNIQNGNEKTGAILGFQEINDNTDKNSFKNNFYLVTDKDFGGIDGVSYSDIAQPLSYDSFFGLSDLNKTFSQSTVTFVFENDEDITISLNPGDALDVSDIPEVPEKSGFTGEWENLKDTNLSQVYFDLVFNPIYNEYNVTTESELTRDNGMPLLLAQGQFSNTDYIQIDKSDDVPVLSKHKSAIESWNIPVFSADTETQLRFAYPEGFKTKSLKIMVKDKDGNWYDVDNTVNGSYLVFSVNPLDTAFCVIDAPNPYKWAIYAASALVAIIIIVIVLRRVKSKKKKAEIKTVTE